MWFSVTSFGAVAERCNNTLSKGRLVFVEGRFETRIWENREGQKVTDLQIVANDVMMLDRPKPTLGPEEATVGAAADDQQPDDLPF